MCGRFTLRTPAADIERAFDVTVPEVESRYNIAPTQPVMGVRQKPDGKRREVVALRWGLVPSWADDVKIGSRMINARAETVARKPAFRKAFARRRCLIVADGFYEWQETEGKKQPYYIHKKGDGPYAFAGLWEHWERDRQAVDSCTIVVTEANELLAPIHDRMPVIVPPDDYEDWLDPASDQKRLEAILQPFPSELLDVYPVNRFVNNPKNDSMKCVERTDGAEGASGRI